MQSVRCNEMKDSAPERTRDKRDPGMFRYRGRAFFEFSNRFRLEAQSSSSPRRLKSTAFRRCRQLRHIVKQGRCVDDSTRSYQRGHPSRRPYQCVDIVPRYGHGCADFVLYAAFTVAAPQFFGTDGQPCGSLLHRMDGGPLGASNSLSSAGRAGSLI